MSDRDPRPAALANYMQRREQTFAAMSNNARRVKIEPNHTWRIRLLPVQMGTDKEPFVDIAQHWWNKQPIFCPKHTSPAWGGDPDYPCPVCELSERLRDSTDEKINDIGYSARCNLKVRGWCVVFDMEDQRGNVDEMPMSEILNPYEFDMYRGTWESFAKFQKWAMSGRRGGKDPSPDGILDLETGCDLLATQGNKGVTLDRCDPNPIFPLDDPKFDEYIAKIWKRVTKPKITIPSEKQLLEVADKIEEYAENGGRGGGGRGRGRGREYDRDDRDYRGRDDRGGRGRGRDRGTDDYDNDRGLDRGRNRSRFSEDQDQDDAPRSRSSRDRDRGQEDRGDRDQDQGQDHQEKEPENAPVARGSRQRPAQSEPAEETMAPPARRSNGQVTSSREAPAEKEQAEEQAPEEQQEEASAPPPTRRSAAAPPPARGSSSRASAEKEDNEEDKDQGLAAPPTRRSAPTSPPPARRTAASTASPDNGVDEQEDNAPEERHDPAPARREAIAEKDGNNGAAEQDDQAPPPVEASGPPPRKSDGIKSRLANLTARGR